MNKTRLMFHPPDPRAYTAHTLWTNDGKKTLGLFGILFKLRVISFRHFDL